MKHYSFDGRNINPQSNIRYTDNFGNKIGIVTSWPNEGDNYKHCHIILKDSKKIALHLNVPAYYIHSDSSDIFTNRKDILKFVKWLDSKSTNPSLTWWQYLVDKWNKDKETQRNTKLRIKTRIRPPYEYGIYMSYNECVKKEPKYRKW